MDWRAAAWAFIFAVGLAFELVMWLDRASGGTLSEEVWALENATRGRTYIRMALVGGWAILTVHLFTGWI